LASDAVIVIELVYALIWEKERSHWICGLLQGDDAQRWPILYHDQKASSSEPSRTGVGSGRLYASRNRGYRRNVW